MVRALMQHSPVPPVITVWRGCFGQTHASVMAKTAMVVVGAGVARVGVLKVEELSWSWCRERLGWM